MELDEVLVYPLVSSLTEFPIAFLRESALRISSLMVQLHSCRPIMVGLFASIIIRAACFLSAQRCPDPPRSSRRILKDIALIAAPEVHFPAGVVFC